MEYAQQPIPPSDGRAHGVDAVLPVVFHIAIPLAFALGSGISNECPKFADEEAGSAEYAAMLTAISPPIANGNG